MSPRLGYMVIAGYETPVREGREALRVARRICAERAAEDWYGPVRVYRLYDEGRVLVASYQWDAAQWIVRKVKRA